MTTNTDTKTLTTTIPATVGSYWLTGYYEQRWGTARFDLSLDRFDAGTVTLLTNADWPTTWKKLHTIMEHRHVEATMRGVLPAADRQSPNGHSVCSTCGGWLPWSCVC